MNESLYPVQGSGVIFRDAFRSQSDTEHINDATVTGVTFSNGVATFAAGNSIAYGPVVPGVKSVRIKGTFTSLTTTLLTLSGSHSVSVAAGTISATGFSSPTIYVDGIASSTLTTGQHEIVVTTATAITANTLGIANFEGALTLIDLFRITLTATEVSLLYQNKLYAGLVKQGLIGYWNFTRQTGYDYSHSGHDMSFNGSTGVFRKQGVWLPGNDFLSATSTATLSSLAECSICGIIRHKNVSGDVIAEGFFSKRGSNTQAYEIFTRKNGAVVFRIKTDAADSETGSGVSSVLTQDKSHYLELIWRDGSLKGYLDMAQSGATKANTGTVDASGNPLYIGSLAGGGGLTAEIPAIVLYNIGLTNEERYQNHQYFKQQGWI